MSIVVFKQKPQRDWRRFAGERWRGKLPIPARGHPLVRKLFEACNEQLTTVQELADRSGVDRQTISGWRYTANPSTVNIVACFNALGLDLVVAPLKERAQ